MESKATVFVVDDDDAIRDSLRMLVKSVGLPVETFASADEFLEKKAPDAAGCMVLDIRMPGMSGLELQERLNELGARLPVIFVTGHGDIPMAVKAIRAGAMDFIEKPFRDQELLDRIQQALQDDSTDRAMTAELETLRQRRDTLTPREHEVMELVVEGLPNKAIAAELALSERTVEIHRSKVMHKMEAGSLPELVRMAMTIAE